MSDAPLAMVYQMKVSLRGISPMIWRRLLIPADLTLYGLRRTIQIAFGWEDDHLHAFHLHGRRYGTMWSGERHRDVHGREITLADLRLRQRQRILYEYDFGDLWKHEIRVEAKLQDEPHRPYPVCIGGARAGPPEDIGRPSGYHALLDRLRCGDTDGLIAGDDDSGDNDDDDPLGGFDPERFGRHEVNTELRREFAAPRDKA